MKESDFKLSKIDELLQQLLVELTKFENRIFWSRVIKEKGKITSINIQPIKDWSKVHSCINKLEPKIKGSKTFEMKRRKPRKVRIKR